LTAPAEGKIVYTPTHRVIGTNGFYLINFDHGGTTDFLIRESGGTSGSTGSNALLINGSGIEASVKKHFPAAVKKGAEIGPDQRFITRVYHESTMARAWQTDSIGFHYYGQWVNVVDRYLGLRFKIRGGIHYGWARLSAKVKRRKITATLTGYAYETIANKAIIAGNTKGAEKVWVQPAALGELAGGVTTGAR